MKFRVSDIAQFFNCPLRSKLQAFDRITKPPQDRKPMEVGKEMHVDYSRPYKDWDRRLLRYKLSRIGKYYEREIDKNIIRGRPDDYRVLRVGTQSAKVVSIIEVKTTSKKNLFPNEKNVAIAQLELYCWLMEPILKKLGYQLHSRHYVEIYRQKDWRLIERIVVFIKGSPSITEEMIRKIFRAYQGKERARFPPPDYVCHNCPKNVKKECWYWRQNH